jgi:hypothetical protein
MPTGFPNKKFNKTCSVCKKSFDTYSNRAKYCNKCKGERHEFNCLNCGKKYIRNDNSVYCKSCKELKVYCSCGCGTLLSVKTDARHYKFIRYKRGHGRTGKRIGEDHPSWAGGPEKAGYALGFRKTLKARVRLRDNYECQECGKTEEANGKKLSCHHIDYDKNNHDIDNLISLCKYCHTKTNFVRENWTSYFQKKIKVINK